MARQRYFEYQLTFVEFLELQECFFQGSLRKTWHLSTKLKTTSSSMLVLVELLELHHVAHPLYQQALEPSCALMPTLDQLACASCRIVFLQTWPLNGSPSIHYESLLVLFCIQESCSPLSHALCASSRIDCGSPQT